MSLLTEQEITQVVRDAANGSAIRRDGSTSYRIARAIEAEVIKKIKAQGPVANLYRDMNSGGKNGCLKVCYLSPSIGFPVYRLPEGD